MTENNPSEVKASISDEQLIDGARILQPAHDFVAGADAQETLTRVVQLFERSGRHFFKTDYPAND
jgi:hypothetical protein